MNLKIIKAVPDLTDLIEYRDELEELLEYLKVNAFENISVISDKTNCKYYEYNKLTKVRRYIKKNEIGSLKKLFQNEYNKSVLGVIEEELSILNRFLKRSNLQNIESTYTEWNKESRKFISPLAVSDQYYAWVWQNTPYATREMKPDEKFFVTSKGEKVRSKSEVIIADTLASKGIPYRYEKELICLDGKRLYPDFQLLDIKRRREVYLEHLGLTDAPEYMNRVVDKTNQYARSGIYVGVNLFFTMESDKHPLNRNTLIGTLDNIFCDYSKSDILRKNP